MRALLLLCVSLMCCSVVRAQAPAPTAAETSITTRIKTLRTLSEADRPGVTKQLALDIRALPAGPHKLRLANSLANLSTEGDAGNDTLTEVTTTLAQALVETPVQSPAFKADEVPAPYLEVASIMRYEHVAIDPKLTAAPIYAKATQLLAKRDADVQHAEFTLNDLEGKPVSLASLRGKVVMVNFWATWCPPCRKEMPSLDALEKQYADKGLVILSISDEDKTKVEPFIAKSGYHPTVLLDPGSKVHEMFHVEGIPKTFVFDRTGKLVATTIDQRTEQQFLQMMHAAGIGD